MNAIEAISLRRVAASGRKLPQPVAYALSAGIIGAALFASATPSPLYETYARLWGFSSVVLTLVYATYAIGVLAALLLAGRVSDAAGRRPVLTIALSALLGATVLFMVADSVAWLFAARAVQGLATGLALGTASAGLLDFHPSQDSEGAGLTNGVVSAAGLGLGALASSAAVQLLPAPRVLPYVVVFILVAADLVGVLLMPEPVAARSRLRLTPQRPHVPGEVRQSFIVAALAVITAYSIGGLFFALGPELAGRVFETGNHLVTGLSLFLLAGVGSVSQLAYGRRAAWLGAAAGSVALALGVALIVLAAAEDSAAVLIIGTVVGGAGFGLAFLGSLRALSAQIPPNHRAGVMSAFFVAAYAALSIPAVLAGLVVPRLGLDATFEILGSAVTALALVVAVQAWRTRPRSTSERINYRVTVRVKFPDGSTTEFKKWLDWHDVGQLYQGSVVPVRYDPSDHSNVELDVPALEAGHAQADAAGKAQLDAQFARLGDPGSGTGGGVGVQAVAGLGNGGDLKAQLLRAAAENPGSVVDLSSASPGRPSSDPEDRLAKLADLKDRGVLSDDEFAAEKAKILGES